MTAVRTAIIIGGGIAGLTTAIALQRQALTQRSSSAHIDIVTQAQDYGSGSMRWPRWRRSGWRSARVR